MTLEGLEQNAVYYVQLRTKYRGALGDWSRRFELLTLKDTIKPGPVTNLAGVFNEGNLTLSWARPAANEDGSPLEDLKDYVVTITPVPADPEWPPFVIYAEGTKAIFTKEDNAAAFGRYRAGLKIVVQARDIVDNLSEPVEIIKAKPRPGKVVNLTWAVEGMNFVAKWQKPTENMDGSPFTDPDGYEVRIIHTDANGNKTTLLKTPYYTTDFILTPAENITAFGGVPMPTPDSTVEEPRFTNRPRGALTLEVRARDSVGQVSDADPKNAFDPPPNRVEGTKATNDTNRIIVEWDDSKRNAEGIEYYEVWVSPNATSTGSYSGKSRESRYLHYTFDYGVPHYFYVVAVDVFGQRSSWHTPLTAVASPNSPFDVDIEPPDAPSQNLTASTASDPALIGHSEDLPAAILVSWAAPLDSAGVVDKSVAGYHVSYSPPVNPRKWEYRDIVEASATSALITPLSSESEYIFRVRSYDKLTNLSPWSAEFTGRSTLSNSDFVLTDISSDIAVITGGSLRSGDFLEPDPTRIETNGPKEGRGWRLMPSGLDILNGRVNARVISTGELRSSELVTSGPDLGQPVWALNLEGNLTVRRARVRGSLTVGAPDITESDNSLVHIASHNYGSPTGKQWAILGDGGFQMRSTGPSGGRLEIHHNGIYGFDVNNNQRFALNTQGQFSLQTTNGGVVFDDNGIRLFSGGRVTVDLNRTGAAYFEGQVRASSGLIGGWELSSVGFFGSLISLRSDLGEIKAGSGTSTVGMRSNYGFWAGAADYFSSPPFSVSPAGAVDAKSGVIGGFRINSTDGFIGGINSATVGMRPSVGIWVGANDFFSAPTRLNIDGRFYSRLAEIQGEIRATRFRSFGSTSGDGNWIEIGRTGAVDPVDEIRFFYNGSISSIRNPSSTPGGILISTYSGSGNTPMYNFTSNGQGLLMYGNSLNMAGGQVTGIHFLYSHQHSGTYLNMGTNGVNVRVATGGGNFFSFGHTDSIHGSLRYGGNNLGPLLKMLYTGSTVQIRDYFDSAYGTLQAHVQAPSSQKFKANIAIWEEDALSKINAATVRSWNRILSEPRRGSPIRGQVISDYKVIGPILEEMPEEIRSGDASDTYDISATIGLMWKAIQELDSKKLDRSVPEPVPVPEPAPRPVV